MDKKLTNKFKEDSDQMEKISRKSFLKGAAGAIGVAALGTLAGCGTTSSPSPTATVTPEPVAADFTYADTIVWDAQYDVVVLGMGASGMSAAKTAADNGAKVVILEKCSEEDAGGNTKVCGQMFAWGHQDVEATKAYYTALCGGRELPEPVLDAIVDGVANMAEILETEFGMDSSEFWVLNEAGILSYMSPEYPEMPGSESMSLVATHMGVSDSYLYNNLKNLVLSYPDSIDVWYSSPAMELIQEPTTGTVVGVQIERDGKVMNVRALNGVCICTGGFENNKEMVQHYLNVINYAPRGGLFNTGDGILMAQKAGADLWHMSVYEGFFGLGGVSWNVGENAHASWISTLNRDSNNTGATILVGTDGDRFLNESEIVRHGHIYENGIWENPTFPEKIWYIFDQTQKDLMESDGLIPEAYADQIMAFDTVEEMAEGTGCIPEKLAQTIADFNFFATNGRDYKAGREAEYMRPFDGDKYYAVYMVSGILNTQGGPMRNENAQVLDCDGNPIPHLYSAGECGGVTVCMYQGGTNIAECITFGRIAGRNAAVAKDALPTFVPAVAVESDPAMPGEITDTVTEQAEYTVGENQYIGKAAGINGDVVVRVTMDGDTISNVEVLAQNETEGIGSNAIEALPEQFIGLSTEDAINAVDGVSGATITSNALKQAVINALLEAAG
ncbi:MAG: FAD-binding protein [Bacteroidia bacterium]|nr:FAD-binding protein [Bacteroidia bacterium]